MKVTVRATKNENIIKNKSHIDDLELEVPNFDGKINKSNVEVDFEAQSLNLMCNI